MARSQGERPQPKRRKLSHEQTKPNFRRGEHNVKAPQRFGKHREEPSSDEDSAGSELGADLPSYSDPGFREDDEDGLESEGDSALDSQNEAQNEERRHQDDLRTISFGALAEAQDALHGTQHERRFHGDDGAAGEDRGKKLQNLRDRLAELREKRAGRESKKKKSRAGQEVKDDTQPTSKHAPAEQSSKRQVTRRRAVIDTSHLFDPDKTSQRLHGDPRFSAAVGGVDEEKVRKNYSFLNEYAGKELQELKNTLVEGKKRKRGKITGEEEAELKKEIGRRENRLKAEAKKEKERAIVREHKRDERQKVKDGKKPFFLKKGQVKERARNELWEKMPAKDRQKAEAKREKRRGQIDMKRKPNERKAG